MNLTSNTVDTNALLTETQAADSLQMSVRTLQAWRTRKYGPPFVRLGRAIRYRRSDLATWLDKNTQVAS